MNLRSPWGLWTSRPSWTELSPAAFEATAGVVSECGYSCLWVAGPAEELSLYRELLRATDGVDVATGVIDVFRSDAARIAADVARIDAAHPCRFILGVGASHPQTAAALGQQYRRPLRLVGDYLDRLDAADPPVQRDRRILGALGPKMLELSARRAAGAHPFLVTPEHTRSAREILGPHAVLAPAQKVILSADAGRARAAARASLAIYLTRENYRRNWKSLGFTDADLDAGGSDRLVDTIVPWGTIAYVSARLREHLDAGADHVAIDVVPLEESRKPSTVGWAELADALGVRASRYNHERFEERQ